MTSAYCFGVQDKYVYMLSWFRYKPAYPISDHNGQNNHTLCGGTYLYNLCRGVLSYQYLPILSLFLQTKRRRAAKGNSKEHYISRKENILFFCGIKTRFTPEEIYPDSRRIRNVLVPDSFCRLHTS